MITKVVFRKRLQNQHKGNLYRFEEPFLSLITKLYTVCQLFAAAPILDTPHRKRRVLRYVHYVWCSIVLIYISVVNIHYINRIHKPLVTIVQIFFSTELLNNPLIVASIILSMYYNGEEYRNIPHELLRIYKVYRNLQPKVSTGNALFRVLHKEMLIMSGAVSTVVSSCFLVDYLRTEPVLIAYLLNSSVFSLANILITFNITQFWLALRVVYQLYRGFNEIMKERLKCFSSINLETSELASKEVHAYTTEISWYQREFHSSRKEASRSYEILDSIRNIYFDLDTIMIRLTKVFGITMLLNLFGSVLSLSVQVFAVFKFFDVENFLGDALVEVYNRVLWVFIHLARILLILITNNAIIEEVRSFCLWTCDSLIYISVFI